MHFVIQPRKAALIISGSLSGYVNWDQPQGSEVIWAQFIP